MPVVGDILAERYRITGPLGAGGMASVWRARDLRLGRDVAVKILLPNLSADPATSARFDREARSLAAAAHPNVVSVFDVEPGDPSVGREPFYVMELCDGGSLAERLATAGRLDPTELAPIVSAVGEGLAELHRRGMVHRDVKPHNILFCDGRPKLADFGLARTASDGLDSLTATGTTIGTLAYLAPELLAGGTATPASDVYGLAVVAFLGLTGRLPRPAASVTEVVEARTSPAPTASATAPDLGAGFDAVLTAALAIDPSLRPLPEAFAAGLAAAADAHAEERRATRAGVAVVADSAMAPTGAVTTVLAAPDVPATGADEDGRAAERPRLLTGEGARRRRPGRSRPALIALGAFGLAVLALLAASGFLGDRRPDDDRIAGPTATRPAAVDESPAPVTPVPATLVPATPVPATPVARTPAPEPPADPDAQPALDAVPPVLARIADARAAGLRERDASALERLVGEVERALLAGDLRRARDRAERLVEQVEKLEDELDDDAADPLLRAAEVLRDAVPGD